MLLKKIGITLLCLYCEGIYAQTGADCKKIQSPARRLACFDEVFQTPMTHAKINIAKPDDLLSKNVSRIYHLENTYNTKADNFIISHSGDTIQITLKSQSDNAFSPVMFWGCVDNITHFQVALKKPMTKNKVLVSIIDAESGEALISNQWQILEHGHLLDIGRGLFAIEKIKHLLNSKQVIYQIVPLKYRWYFDIENLNEHIKPLRESCGW